LLSILNDVLDLSKVEAGQFDLEQQPFALVALLGEVKMIIKPLAADKQLALQINIDPELSEVVQGDRRSLSQILMNLCVNAIKFTEQGQIVISVRSLSNDGQQTRIRFDIEDTGIGIPDTAKQRIFQHFSQADSSITRRYGGTGLGLSICKNLVDLHHGTIGYHSNVGQGSLFWFEIDFPVLDSSALSPDVIVSPPRQNNKTQPLSILLVEDTEINQRVAQGLLECDGHRVCIANDGYSALSIHDQQGHDLILMDIHLPDMDGMETARRMRQHHDIAKANTPIVALTASVTPAEIDRYHAAGINTVLGKPLQLEQLRQVLSELPSMPMVGSPALQAADGLPDEPLVDEPSVPSSSALLNLALLQQHLEALGEDKFRELLGVLYRQCNELLSGLEAALADQDLPLLTGTAHKLAGASANFGLTALNDISREIEQMGRGKQGQQLGDKISAARKLYIQSQQRLEQTVLPSSE
ncbi:MAG: ATP-binding protein, partial [Halopseudomonas sp.]